MGLDEEFFFDLTYLDKQVWFREVLTASVYMYICKIYIYQNVILFG